MQRQPSRYEVGPLPHPPLIPPQTPQRDEPVTVPPQPMIYVTPRLRWRYKTLVHDSRTGALLTEQELEELGAAGWELTGVAAAAQAVYFYFKQPQ